MATAISASALTSSFVCTFGQKSSATASSPSVIGFPPMAMKGKVTCSLENKDNAEEKSISSKAGMGASLIAATCAATMTSPAVALVDERMSTEGTGLPFGLSNNLLGWLLLGMFGLIWTFYFVYTSSLDEDEDSGLSL